MSESYCNVATCKMEEGDAPLIPEGVLCIPGKVFTATTNKDFTTYSAHLSDGTFGFSEKVIIS